MLFYAAVTDIKCREIPNGAVLAILFYSLGTSLLMRNRAGIKIGLIVGAFVFVVNLTPALLFPDSIGGGDVKLLSALAFHMGEGFFVLMFFLVLMLLGVMVYALVKKKGLRYSVPMAPYIFAAGVLCIFVDTFVYNIV
ncbi:MAG: Peptidase A24A prepilin type IV [Clostridia bacterium 41_269]|nr:MAG: Peptidase A24A prepilin type IV [Clostridia bacterium 41_269]